MRLIRRLSALEAVAPRGDAHDPSWRFAVVRGPIDQAEQLPQRLGLVGGCPVFVTEQGWDGGDPVVVSPPLTIAETSSDALRLLASFRVTPAGEVELPPRTVAVSSAVQEGEDR